MGRACEPELEPVERLGRLEGNPSPVHGRFACEALSARDGAWLRIPESPDLVGGGGQYHNAR